MTALPDWIPGYRVLRRLGMGGQGVVYQAVHERSGRHVALKVLRAGVLAGREARDRFQREVELVAALRHENIVALHDCGVERDMPWCDMELVEGRSFLDHVRALGLPVQDILRLFLQVCDGVAHAHGKGVIHRDLKPENIHVDSDGRVRILDFGIARPEAGATLTAADQLVGTLAYTAPEQLAGHVPRGDVATDVYALGVVLYEAFTGRKPHDPEGGMAEVSRRVLENDPVPPSRLRPEIDADLDRLVLTALEKSPERRYRSVHALADDIRRYLAGEPLSVRRSSAWYVLRKTVRRHRLAAAATLLVAIALGCLGAVVAWSAVRVRHERDLAVAAQQRAEAEAEASRAVTGFLMDFFERSNPLDPESGFATLRDALGDVSRTVSDDLRLQPQARADLLDVLGHANLAAGLPDWAADLAGHALAIRREQGDAAGLADSLELMGSAQAAMGRPQEATAALEEALALRRGAFGVESLAVARTLTVMGRLSLDRGNPEEARRLLLESLRVRARLGDVDDLETAESLHLLATADLLQGRATDALPRLERALAIRERLHHGRHPLAAETRRALGEALAATGEFERAEALLRDAVGALRQTLGNQHPRSSAAGLALGRVLAQQGRLADAEEAIRDVADLQAALLGAEHPQRIPTLESLAEVVERRGRVAEAAELRAEVLRQRGIAQLAERVAEVKHGMVSRERSE